MAAHVAALERVYEDAIRSRSPVQDTRTPDATSVVHATRRVRALEAVPADHDARQAPADDGLLERGSSSPQMPRDLDRVEDDRGNPQQADAQRPRQAPLGQLRKRLTRLWSRDGHTSR